MLVEPGKSVRLGRHDRRRQRHPPDVAAFFTGIAISMYCPQLMGSLGNGTFLNFLQTPGLPRHAGTVARLLGRPVASAATRLDVWYFPI